MTPVLIGKGLLLKGWSPKIEDTHFPGSLLHRNRTPCRPGTERVNLHGAHCWKFTGESLCLYCSRPSISKRYAVWGTSPNHLVGGTDHAKWASFRKWGVFGDVAGDIFVLGVFLVGCFKEWGIIGCLQKWQEFSLRLGRSPAGSMGSKGNPRSYQRTNCGPNGLPGRVWGE